jgi:hypothetical protein
LERGFSSIEFNYKDVEKELIRHFEPVLNLKYWKNPLKKEIQELRAICATEAQLRGI